MTIPAENAPACAQIGVGQSPVSTTESSHNSKKQLSDFVGALFSPDDIVEVRLLPAKRSHWYPASELPGQTAMLLRKNASGQNIYVGANPRRAKGGSKAADVLLARSFFVDFDNSTTPHDALRWIEEAGLPKPTVVVTSGHGVHCYWRLAEPLTDMGVWTDAQKALIGALDSDSTVHDPPRIMRLPGFLNLKFEPVPCVIVACEPNTRYDLAEIVAYLPTAAPVKGATTPQNGASGLEALARATAYVAKVLGVGEGQRNQTAFKLAALLLRDFDLTDSDAWALLTSWNQTNSPPLDERELGAVLDSAKKHAKGETGSKLRKAPEGGNRMQRPKPVVEPFTPFPVDALPEPMHSFVLTSAKAIGCDPSYLALPMLTVLAAAIGNARRLQLKRGWSVPAIIWAAIVGESGTMKTPAFSLAMRPIWVRQQLALKQHAENMRLYEDQLAQYEEDLAARKKGKGTTDRPKKPKMPVAQRCVVSDVTVEAIAPILKENDRGVLVIRDELAAWLGSFDKYSSGKGSDSAHWLSMHSGESIIVDRKSGNPRTIYVPMASVSICGGIQPGILHRVFSVEHRQNGLLPRFLLACPPRFPKHWTEAEINPAMEEEMAQVVNRLYELEPEGGLRDPNTDIDFGFDGNAGDEAEEVKPIIVGLTTAAKELWVAYYNSHAREQVDLTGDLSAAWSKLEEYAARLALVIHFIRWAADDPTLESTDLVDSDSMSAGIRLAMWFKGEARRVYAMFAESEEDRNQRRLVEWIGHRGGSVTARDVQRGCKWLPDGDTALTELVNAGYGCWVDIPTTAKGGRPARAFRLAVDTTPKNTSIFEVVSNADGFDASEFSSDDEINNERPSAVLNTVDAADCRHNPQQTAKDIGCVETPEFNPVEDIGRSAPRFQTVDTIDCRRNLDQPEESKDCVDIDAVNSELLAAANDNRGEP